MIPFLTYPLALIALASLPALAAIYILRNKFRRRQVSSLMLWQFHVQSKEGGSKVHRLQLPLLFFLELLALLLLVTAATGPHWKLPQSTRPLIVVLDDSFSMRAVRDGLSTQQRAKDYLEKLYRRQPPPSTRLVLAGKDPQLLGGILKSWAEVNEQLADWKCWAPNASIESAITLASEIGKQQANILVLSDHAPFQEAVSAKSESADPTNSSSEPGQIFLESGVPNLGDRLEWHSFGTSLDNLAVVNASRTAYGDQDRCLVEIANLSAKPRSGQMLVQAGTNNPQGSIFQLAAREKQRFVFNVPVSAPVLKASVESDTLAEDNQVQLLPPVRKRIRVQVALTNTADAELMERTLDASGLRAALTVSPELLINDSTATPAGSNCWSLHWLRGEPVTAFTGPFVIDPAHPLAQGVGLPGIVWAANAALTNEPGEVPAILAGNVPLVSVREDLLGRRHVTLNLTRELSTLPQTPDWPVLIWNLLQWRATQMPGLIENNVRLGAEVVLKTAGESVTVTWPDGQRREFAKSADQLALESPLPGIYKVVMGSSTNEFAVNPLAAEESDLSVCVTGHWGEWGSDAERRFEESSVAWVFALVALGLMVLHLGLIATGRGR